MGWKGLLAVERLLGVVLFAGCWDFEEFLQCFRAANCPGIRKEGGWLVGCTVEPASGQRL